MEAVHEGEPVAGRRARVLRRLAISLACLAAAVVIFKQAGWFFPVVSGSMEPTVETGEWVFLRYGVDPVERFNIVAFTDVGGGASIKRIIGLPGEVIALDPTGDVRVEGAPLRGGAASAPDPDLRLQAPVRRRTLAPRWGVRGSLVPGRRADGRAR